MPDELIVMQEAATTLSRRERKVAEMMHHGYLAEEISRELQIRPATVRVLIHRIRQKIFATM
jgi:DNA-binding NarL/FixJ family response regulator